MSEYDYDLTTWVNAGDGGPMHTRARWKTIGRLAASATPAESKPKLLRRLYVETYGAEPGPAITPERMRASIIEACDEAVDRSDPS